MDPNPYESPHMPSDLPDGRSLFVRHLLRITVVEWLVIIVISGILISLLLPAVSSSPRHRLRPKIAPSLQSVR